MARHYAVTSDDRTDRFADRNAPGTCIRSALVARRWIRVDKKVEIAAPRFSQQNTADSEFQS
jgi:hypothetical protein